MPSFDNLIPSSLASGVGDFANNLRATAQTILGNTATTVAANTSATSFTSRNVETIAESFPVNLGTGVVRPLGTDVAIATDNRVRLRAMQNSQVYGPQGNDNLLSILYDTNGVLFPYTPTIDWNQSVDYISTSLTHSNQDYQTYKSTPSTGFHITGDFTVQNQREAVYMLAVIHFLRVVSKMSFGKLSPNPGMPPPVLLFSGYGTYMFNDLPVIVKDHSYSLGKEIDYVNVMIAGEKVTLPSILQISLNLVVQNTPKKWREEFNLEQFRTGQLMKKKGWI